MTNVIEILRDHGISLRSISPGRYYTTCPQCSHKRKKPHQKLKCLGGGDLNDVWQEAVP
jgi:hypothetical protein